MIPWIAPGQPLPAVERALAQPNGLLAATRDLTTQRLLEAYPRGIFPWYGEGQPVLWWSPDPRMVLYLDEFRISRTLGKRLRRIARDGQWRVRIDTCFERVMRECAAPREGQDGTWITERIVDAYGGLHRRGCAHSFETWHGDRLIGGLYGVSLGRMFYGESMFARETDASKVALAALVHTLQRHDFRVIDCQQNTGHLASLGAREIDRRTFLHEIAELTRRPAPDWTSIDVDWSGL